MVRWSLVSSRQQYYSISQSTLQKQTLKYNIETTIVELYFKLFTQSIGKVLCVAIFIAGTFVDSFHKEQGFLMLHEWTLHFVPTGYVIFCQIDHMLSWSHRHLKVCPGLITKNDCSQKWTCNSLSVQAIPLYITVQVLLLLLVYKLQATKGHMCNTAQSQVKEERFRNLLVSLLGNIVETFSSLYCGLCYSSYIFWAGCNWGSCTKSAKVDSLFSLQHRRTPCIG